MPNSRILVSIYGVPTVASESKGYESGYLQAAAGHNVEIKNDNARKNVLAIRKMNPLKYSLHCPNSYAFLFCSTEKVFEWKTMFYLMWNQKSYAMLN